MTSSAYDARRQRRTIPQITCTHLCKRRLTRIRNHCKSSNDLFLNISLWLPRRVRCARIQELQEAFDDCVKIRYQRLGLNTFAEVDECGGGVRMNTTTIGSIIIKTAECGRESATTYRASGASSAGISAAKICWWNCSWLTSCRDGLLVRREDKECASYSNVPQDLYKAGHWITVVSRS